MIAFCAARNRRSLVLAHPPFNGIDYLEVDTAAAALTVVFLRSPAPLHLKPVNFAIAGGETITGLSVTAVTLLASPPNALRLKLSGLGDFAGYTLSLRISEKDPTPPATIDPELAAIAFTFQAGCPATGDCAAPQCCPPALSDEPEINYLAKDFSGFRQAMLDRMAVLLPDWTERHAADLGVTLVEVLAYVADHLSYRQDAVATEAYLGTARSRISLRRHARLVDYRAQEGCNARVWLHLHATHDGIVLPKGSLVLPRLPGQPAVVPADTPAALQLIGDGSGAFATMAEATLFTDQNAMSLYTWGDTGCCLPVGTTQATLAGTPAGLAAGQVLVFEEVLGPLTGAPGDADPTHRWPVRLTQASVGTDPVTATPITTIAWGAADALPFALCLSSVTDATHGAQAIPDVSVARGNIVPADHGFWRPTEVLGTVPDPPPAPIATGGGCGCGDGAAPAAPLPFFFPALQFGPLTFTAPFDPGAPASALVAAAAAAAAAPQPSLEVSDDGGARWTPEPDLLALGPAQFGVVPEIERDGTIFLRFGDGVNGAAADPGKTFTATYRTGNGTVGNVGADTLAHVIPAAKAGLPPSARATAATIGQVRNPLAAAGGIDADSVDTIREIAPESFLTQLRAVTADDYGMIAMRDPAVQAARGTLRWTGSWRTAFVTVEPATLGDLGAALIDTTTAAIERTRMAGTDCAVTPAIIVGLRLALLVCVEAGYRRSDVRAALMALFTSATGPDGQPGLLSPSRFTFGETIYLSPLIAAAQGVDGVASVAVTAFERIDDPGGGAVQDGLTLHRLEIARIDNDPSRPDRGMFTLDLRGGQ